MIIYSYFPEVIGQSTSQENHNFVHEGADVFDPLNEKQDSLASIGTLISTERPPRKDRRQRKNKSIEKDNLITLSHNTNLLIDSGIDLDSSHIVEENNSTDVFAGISSKSSPLEETDAKEVSKRHPAIARKIIRGQKRDHAMTSNLHALKTSENSRKSTTNFINILRNNDEAETGRLLKLVLLSISKLDTFDKTLSSLFECLCMQFH